MFVTFWKFGSEIASFTHMYGWLVDAHKEINLGSSDHVNEIF